MNYNLFKSINQLAGHYPFLDGLMAGVTNYALIIYAIVLLLIWFIGKDQYKKTVVYAAITGVLGLFLNFVIGHIYFEPRPFVTHPVNLLVKHTADASFPSDHTTGAFALALAVLFVHRRIGIGMLLFAFLTAFSRIYVGHHYPLDILGSFIVSLVISSIVYKLRPFLEPIANAIIHIYNRIPLVPKTFENKGSLKSLNK
ncbi:undecaprenyl-diphosphatase [Peribacillus huizhouensis]|uniref:Undecaprenyl-diphosphatase n=1 Tax=Peribacillus huizhouensis TaxID=1501239 RepID=A0ABR6CNC6_9BACI|nr:undecaprenyl-diphosphatase [Peribacillus huizhouensis]MBA9026441.1 undecaprenyl-diphosphatase [Peribacillus huizhouensis]